MIDKLILSCGVLFMGSLTTQAATVSLFTGGDVGEGIDFSGHIVHAINIAGNGTGSTAAPDLLVSGVTFQDAYAAPPNIGALIPDVAPNWIGINNWGNKPAYGATTNDNNLEEVMWDIGHGSNSPTLIFTNLDPVSEFIMQVLVSDNAWTSTRLSSYQFIKGDLTTGTVEDQLLNISLTSLQTGSAGASSGNPIDGVVVTLLGYSDSAGTLSFRGLNATGTGDNNSIASGLILTQVPEPSTTALLGLGGLGLILRRRL